MLFHNGDLPVAGGTGDGKGGGVVVALQGFQRGETSPPWAWCCSPRRCHHALEATSASRGFAHLAGRA